MKIFWKKYREIIVVLAYILLLGLLFNFAIRPLLAGISQNIEKMQKETIDQERRLGKIKEASGLEKQSERIKKEAENMRVLAERDRIVALLEMIEKIAEETGNEIEIKTNDEKAVGTEKGGKDLIAQLPTDKFIKMKITVSGKYANFANFVRKIESMKYWADIISLRIAASEPDSPIDKPSSSPFQKSVPDSASKKEKNAASAGVIAEVESVFYLDE